MRSKLFVTATALAVVWFFVPPQVGAADTGATDEGGEAVESANAEIVSGNAVGLAVEADALTDATDAELADALLEPDLSNIEPLAVPAAPAGVYEPPPSVALGEIGYDADGNEGRVHVVIKGDTLWDISAAYLGSAWVWPSIWLDNEDIENPHLIVPDDRIWITETEMRRLTREEAEERLARGPSQPAEMEEPATPPPAPVVPEPAYAAPAPRQTVRIARQESADLITADQLDSSVSIVDAIPTRLMLSQGDEVYIGLGENDVAVGDQFTIFHTVEKVFDPDTEELLGYHVDMVGWVDVVETHPETSRAEVRRSDADIRRGDRLVPRKPPLLEVTVQDSPEGVTGNSPTFLTHAR